MPKNKPRQPPIPHPQPTPNPPTDPQKTTPYLNLLVLNRHNPAITTILSIAPYAVVYTFSPATSNWEKQGIEGTLFVVSLTPTPTQPERYGILVLNRRGLENFEAELQREEDVEVGERFVILQTGEGGIYGLWIFAGGEGGEGEEREVVAGVMVECAARAWASARRVGDVVSFS